MPCFDIMTAAEVIPCWLLYHKENASKSTLVEDMYLRQFGDTSGSINIKYKDSYILPSPPSWFAAIGNTPGKAYLKDAETASKWPLYTPLATPYIVKSIDLLLNLLSKWIKLTASSGAYLAICSDETVEFHWTLPVRKWPNLAKLLRTIESDLAVVA